MPDHRPPQPHGSLEEVLSNVYFVQGSMRMGPGVRISRCMVVLKLGDELTLVNPVRLDSEGEAQLKRLGKVRHAVKLGHHHGCDDPYYVEALGATHWVLDGESDGPTADREVMSSEHLPVAGATLFEFRDTIEPEGALLIPEHRLLLTCDSVQHHGDYRGNSLMARAMMPFLGFKRGTQIGPVWRRESTRKEGPTLEADYHRLLELDFDSVIGAHGGARLGGAHDALRAEVERVFAP